MPTIGGAVRGGHQDHAEREEFLEEQLQYHGIANVGHLELVETQQPRLGHNLFGDRRYWIELEGDAR